MTAPNIHTIQVNCDLRDVDPDAVMRAFTSAIGSAVMAMVVRPEDAAEAAEWYVEIGWDWTKCDEANRRPAGPDATRLCPGCRGGPYVKVGGLSRLCPWCRGAGMVHPKLEAYLRPRAARAMLEADDETAFLDNEIAMRGFARRPGETDAELRARLQLGGRGP